MNIPSDSQALITNDIKVLVAELNARVKEAAERGLDVRLKVSTQLNVSERAYSCPVVAVELFAEVK